jgi:Spy/CpxP family protein refolding chaperone
VKEWKVILATLVIFGTGVVTGGLLVRQTSLKQPRAKFPPPPVFPGAAAKMNPKDLRPGHEQQRIAYLRQLTDTLELAPDQAAQIGKLITDSQQRTRAVWETVQPKFNEEVRKVREQIRGVLTPEQRKKFDEANKQRQRKEGMRPPGEQPAPFSAPRPGQPRNPAAPRPGPSTPDSPSPSSPDAPK